MKRPLVAIVPLVLIAASSSSASSSEDLMVQDGDSVEVHYVLTLDDGSQVDSSRDRGDTLSFTVGSGQVIPGFDDAVRGGSVGDIIEAVIQPEDGYGQPNPDFILDLPIAEGQEDVAAGDEVYLSNGQPALVLSVADGIATVDANHKLAGEVLHFEVEIIAITRS